MQWREKRGWDAESKVTDLCSSMFFHWFKTTRWRVGAKEPNLNLHVQCIECTMSWPVSECVCVCVSECDCVCGIYIASCQNGCIAFLGASGTYIDQTVHVSWMETPRLTCNVVNSDCMNANTSPQPVVYDIDVLLNIYMFDFKDQTLFSRKLDSFPTPQQRTRTYMARLLGSPMPFTKSKASQNCFQEKQLNTHHPHGVKPFVSNVWRTTFFLTLRHFCMYLPSHLCINNCLWNSCV